MRFPCRVGILKGWSYQNFIDTFLNFNRAYPGVSLQEVKGFHGVVTNVGDIGVSTLVMCCDTKCLTFIWVDGHFPLVCPVSNIVNVLLQVTLIFYAAFV